MARRKKQLPILEHVRIETLAAEGKALAHVDGQVLFVPFVAPGDLCDVQVVKKKRNFMEGKLVQMHEASPCRVDPKCIHFGYCGGCKWQHLPYNVQLRAKDQMVHDALERIGKVEVGEYLPIWGSKSTERYRNKLEFTFSHRRWLLPGEMSKAMPEEEALSVLPGLGFHIPGMFDKVLDIDVCYLGSAFMDEVRLFVREYCLARPEEYPFFDLKAQEGLMRTLMLRSTSIGQFMVVVVFYKRDEVAIESLMSAIADRFPEISSLLYVINSKCNDTIADQEIHVYRGYPYIEEEMEGLRFRISAKSFYQTNSDQAYELYKVARDFAALTGRERVYDLYTGTGTIANFVAGRSASVVGIDYVPEAIEDAKVNSVINGIDNTTFYAGDMKDVLTMELMEHHGRPDVIITDPPRAGMHESVIATILRATPKRIVYISCNPSTQARDLALLVEASSYRVVRSRSVDMFPHTHHIENVVLLEQV
ncbi:MAG: 23S rRNA (uracil(1939)-C(5))-methyltransferase RlmD [Porphyromonadaceae bacterium]|nr:23S rRNA (uracil(1939)-C(5))-methyltransferase RlmD [Porphyromonadaceae bacterium]